MPFTATWMDLEIIIVSEVRERQVSYDITYIWNLNYINELIKQTWLSKGIVGMREGAKLGVWD